MAHVLATNPVFVSARAEALVMNILLTLVLLVFWALAPALETAGVLLGTGPYEPRDAGSSLKLVADSLPNRVMLWVLRLCACFLEGIVALYAMVLVVELVAWFLLGHAV